ncbi:hypothetical protein ILUMI_13463 [Ignelater luminosus]|uniref:Uncharacterized protein n=1 Tax=Ignelater luminosus TaxID=2038154 RepID=A0A8K0G5T1_IGNLU|nr:hypothetical protein ILUMI_13463 [Ignelater luminosus]
MSSDSEISIDKPFEGNDGDCVHESDENRQTNLNLHEVVDSEETIAQPSTSKGCQYQLKCFEMIGPKGWQKTLDNFYGLSSKDIQDAYLYGLIKKKSVARQRPRFGEGYPKSASYEYVVL